MITLAAAPHAKRHRRMALRRRLIDDDKRAAAAILRRLILYMIRFSPRRDYTLLFRPRHIIAIAAGVSLFISAVTERRVHDIAF